MRRIKSVALSIPSVVGPYFSINCTLTLLKSRIRKSSVTGDGYRKLPEYEGFVDYMGAVQSIVTSGAVNDSGLFDTNLRDERFLPFEGEGGESTWKLDLPKVFRAFDYDTISDVLFHIRYTARQGIEPSKVKKSLDDLFSEANQAGLALLFNLRYEFPTEWSKFVTGDGIFEAAIRKDYFPYFTKSKEINITGFELYDGRDITKHRTISDQSTWNAATGELKKKQAFIISTNEDVSEPKILTRTKDANAFLIINYSL
jgi:hypothetical protein